MEKARIPPRLRQRVIERDGMRCVYCGLDLERNQIHLDHVVPEAEGGATSYDNLQVTCAKCNTEKGTLTEDQFMAKLRARAIRILERIGYE